MDYQGLHILYWMLLCAALWFNRACWPTFALSVIVGVSVLAPVPWGDTPTIWYFKCLVIELGVVIGALAARSPASHGVIMFTGLLSVVHLIGAWVGPAEGLGPYKLTIPFFEAGSLLTCVLFSADGLKLIERRRIAVRTQKDSHA